MAVTEWIGSPGDPVAVDPPDRKRASLRVAPISVDERLARQVARDDRAFVAIYERYHQTLYRYCRAMLRDDTDAQDAAQSTWTRALIALRRGKRDAPLMPWLFRIAHNESISQVRRRTRQRPVPDAETAGEATEAHGESASAEQQAIDREQFAQLLDDLQALPDRLRGALLMRELGGFSHDEIATSLGTSVGAAKQSILEARRGLQEFEAGRALICDEVTRRVSGGDRRTLRGRQIRAHLRVCEPCSAFAAAIEGRRRSLRAYAPTLAAPAAAAGLAHALGASGAGATATGVSAGAATSAGLAGAGAPSGAVVAVAGKSATAALVAKTLAGVAVVVAAGATAHAISGSSHHHARPSAFDRRPRAERGGPIQAAARASSHSSTLAAGAGSSGHSGIGSMLRPGPLESGLRSRAGGRPTATPLAARRASAKSGHKPPAPAPAPRGFPRQLTRPPVGPARTVPGWTPPGRTPSGPGQRLTAPGQTPAAPAQTAPAQTSAPPAETAPAQAVPANAQTPDGQPGTPLGQSRPPEAAAGLQNPSSQSGAPAARTRVAPRRVRTPVGQTPTSPSAPNVTLGGDPESSGATVAPVDGSPNSGGDGPTSGGSTGGSTSGGSTTGSGHGQTSTQPSGQTSTQPSGQTSTQPSGQTSTQPSVPATPQAPLTGAGSGHGS